MLCEGKLLFIAVDSSIYPCSVDPTKNDRLVYTPAEFAALFGKSQTWGYRQLYAGKVKAITEYGRTLIPKSEVERVLQEAGIYEGAKKAKKELPPKLKPAPEASEPRAEKPGKLRANDWRAAVTRRRRPS